MVGSSLPYLGVVVIGLLHGAEPGHGWPVAASYALNKTRTWSAGLLAGVVIGVGHLVSSIAVVAVFVLAADAFELTSFGWVRYVAGVLLILLGIRELRGGAHHDDEGDDAGDTAYRTSVTTAPPEGPHDHTHGHDGHTGHARQHAHDGGVLGSLRQFVPFVGGHSHSHDNGDDAHGLSAEDPNGLWGIAGAAFLLGFAHEEEVQILGFCTGASDHCVQLMLVYASAVVVSLVTLTLLLVAGFERYEERMAGYAEYFPLVSGGVLILMGLGFITGVL